MNDPPVAYYDLHRYVMLFARYWCVQQLKVVAKTDQMSLQAGMLQKPVVKTFAVSDSVTCMIKGHTWNNNQVSFISLVVRSDCARLKDAECSLLQGMQSLNQTEHHVLAADRRIQNPFTGFEGVCQDICGIGFVVGRGIQRNAFGMLIFLKR